MNMLKPDPEECACGCGVVGRPKKQAWKDGLPPHVARCDCPRCRAPRYKRNAARRERRIGADVGGRRNIGSGAFGGADTIGGVCNCEETAKESLVGPLRRWWGTKAMQEKTTRLLEQRLIPNAFVASWDGKPRLVVMEYDSFRQLCELARDAAA